MRIMWLAFALLMLSCLIFTTLQNYQEPSDREITDENLLQATFNDESCTNPCWRGIEVGVSSRQSVKKMLHDEGLLYDPEWLYTYHVSLKADSPLWKDAPRRIADIHIGENEKVYAMSFVLNLCPSTVIEAYNEYPEVEQTDRRVFLTYPRRGLDYWLNSETKRVEGVFLWPLEHFTDWGGEKLAWTDIADDFDDNCVDALSQP